MSCAVASGKVISTFSVTGEITDSVWLPLDFTQ